MDKRYKPLTPHEQLELRLRLAAEIEAHPEWPFSQVIRHIRKTLHLTVSEGAKVCRVSEQMVTAWKQECAARGSTLQSRC